MSGTSCDGVDLALIETSGSGPKVRFKLLHHYHKPYTKTQREGLFHLLEPGKADIGAVSQVNFYLAGQWARAIAEFLKRIHLPAAQIDLIGSHGQTLRHHPYAPEPYSWQIGNAATIAALTARPACSCRAL